VTGSLTGKTQGRFYALFLGSSPERSAKGFDTLTLCQQKTLVVVRRSGLVAKLGGVHWLP
jgi:hypothetical protein